MKLISLPVKLRWKELGGGQRARTYEAEEEEEY